MANINKEKFSCSFCGKTEDQVRRLIAGPDGAFICDECVEICAGIIEEEVYGDRNNVAEEEIKVIQRYGDNIYKPNPTNPKEFIQIENNFHGKDKMDKDLRGEYVLICEEFYYFSRLSPLDIPDGMRPNIPKVQTSYGVITKDAAEFINYVKQHVELCKYTDAK